MDLTSLPNISSIISTSFKGTEPWYFYFVNGILNFNLVFALALFSLPLTALMETLLHRFNGECLCFIHMYLEYRHFYHFHCSRKRSKAVVTLSLKLISDKASKISSYCGIMSVHFSVQNLGRPYWLTLSPMYLWMLVFFTRPHKEERFLFPIYPLICLCGAVALSSLQV